MRAREAAGCGAKPVLRFVLSGDARWAWPGQTSGHSVSAFVAMGSIDAGAQECHEPLCSRPLRFCRARVRSRDDGRSCSRPLRQAGLPCRVRVNGALRETSHLAAAYIDDVDRVTFDAHKLRSVWRPRWFAGVSDESSQAASVRIHDINVRVDVAAESNASAVRRPCRPRGIDRGQFSKVPSRRHQ